MASDSVLFGESLPKASVAMIPPLALAFVGDAVYELYVRTDLAREGMTKTNRMHLSAVSLVKAKAQALMMKAITDDLTEEELAVSKRGRNAKSGHQPKGATVAEYRWATGFEALIGYLYLLGEQNRLRELLDKGRLALRDAKKE